MISCLNIFIGICTTISTSVVDQLSVNTPDLKNVNDKLKVLFLILSPHYCLGRGILDLTVQYQFAQARKNLGLTSSYSGFDFNIIGKNILSLFIQGIVFFILNMLIEYRFFIRTSRKQVLSSVKSHKDEDDDVRAERLRILSLEKKSKGKDEIKDYLKIVNMSKIYTNLKNFKTKKHLAVDSLCIGIDKGECFGLLGINGAGKTYVLSFKKNLFE